MLDRPIGEYSPKERTHLIADVPDDHNFALCDELTVWENLELSTMMWDVPRAPRKVPMLRIAADRLVKDFEIKPAALDVRVGRLSGGNRRRVVLARELSKEPRVAVLCFPTTGLDIRSVDQVKHWARELAARGAAVLYIGSDLDELLDIADRVAVMARGRVTGVLEADEATLENIGRLMLARQSAVA